MNILCVGYTWRGANEGSLFNALSQNGNIISIVETNNFFPQNGNDLSLRIIERLIHKKRRKVFNEQILKRAKEFKPTVALFYKSTETEPQTIIDLKSLGIFTVNIYPDVSFFTHGKNLIRSIPHYNLIISTKSFSKNDLKSLNVTNVEFVPHGFDPALHRTLKNESKSFESDIAFIGVHTPNKEQLLKYLGDNIEGKAIKIWGNYWEKSSLLSNSNIIFNPPVYGDLYAMAISNAKIALGLLSEKVYGASSGDLITARTFEIPGIGSLMLHERTEEVIQYFEEDKEIVCFSSQEELVDKSTFYLKHELKRATIAQNGKLRAHRDHTYQKRSQEIIQIISTYLKNR